MRRSTILLSGLLLLAALPAFASSDSLMTEIQTGLVFQVGVLLLVVKLGGMAAQKLKVPTVLGELITGIVIGPYALGGIPLPGFAHGLFGLGPMDAGMPVSPELYGIATIASIILLFVSGLETDLGLFLKYSVAGGIVGIGGVVISFSVGAIAGMLMFGGGFMDAQNLFLGIMTTATSVGITARILSDRKKMDSPEGVTILAAAVFDDVLGIVFLAVVMGITTLSAAHGGGAVDWGKIGLIAAKAFGLWLGFTALGLIFANRIAKVLKRFKHAGSFSILALGLALLLAGFFQMEGLAMIIGAYVMGLSLSKTDISHIIIEKVHVLYDFFVPIFFAVMGMLVDLTQFLSWPVLAAGLLFTALAVVSKVVGCGLPALFTGFNAKGALRIGIGMVPRGEVALIIAGIGMSSGILDSKVFGMGIMMTLITTVVAPFGLSAALKLPGAGTRKATAGGEDQTADFAFPSEDVALLVTDTMTHQLQSEGFYVQTMDIDEGLAQVRKDESAFSMQLDGPSLQIQASQDNMHIVRAAVFEAVASLNQNFEKLKTDFDPASISMTAATATEEDLAPMAESAARAIDRSCILLDLKAGTKEAVIEELLRALQKAGKVRDYDQALADIMERERSMSTGMQDGIALPHAKTDAVDEIAAAVGIKRGGMDFASLDGQPTTIIVLSVSSKKNPGPHLQFLANVGRALHDEARRADILKAKKVGEVASLLGI